MNKPNPQPVTTPSWHDSMLRQPGPDLRESSANRTCRVDGHSQADFCAIWVHQWRHYSHSITTWDSYATMLPHYNYLFLWDKINVWLYMCLFFSCPVFQFSVFQMPVTYKCPFVQLSNCTFVLFSNIHCTSVHCTYVFVQLSLVQMTIVHLPYDHCKWGSLTLTFKIILVSLTQNSGKFGFSAR